MKTQPVLSPLFFRRTFFPLLAIVLFSPLTSLSLMSFGFGITVSDCLSFYGKLICHPFAICCLFFFLVFAVLWYRSEGALRRFYYVWLVFFALMYCPGTIVFLSFNSAIAMQGDFLVSLASYLIAFMCFMVLLLCVCGFSAWYSKRGSDEDSEEAKLLEPHH